MLLLVIGIWMIVFPVTAWSDCIAYADTVEHGMAERGITLKSVIEALPEHDFYMAKAKYEVIRSDITAIVTSKPYGNPVIWHLRHFPYRTDLSFITGIIIAVLLVIKILHDARREDIKLAKQRRFDNVVRKINTGVQDDINSELVGARK